MDMLFDRSTLLALIHIYPTEKYFMQLFLLLFLMQNRTVRLNTAALVRDPCKILFKHLNIIPLSSLFILQSFLFVKSKNIFLGTTICILTSLGILIFYSILFTELAFLKILLVIIFLEYVISFHQK